MQTFEGQAAESFTFAAREILLKLVQAPLAWIVLQSIPLQS